MWSVRFASFEPISGGITCRREVHVDFSEKTNVDTGESKKRKKLIDQGEEEYNERKGEAGRGFSCWETHQRSFPKFHSFFTISFFVSTFVCFFMHWIHLIPTVKHFSVQMTAVEQLKHKSESGWLGDSYNRFERRWKKKTNRENGMRKYRLRIKMVSQITYFCYISDSQQFCPTNWGKMASFYLIVQH